MSDDASQSEWTSGTTTSVESVSGWLAVILDRPPETPTEPLGEIFN